MKIELIGIETTSQIPYYITLKTKIQNWYVFQVQNQKFSVVVFIFESKLLMEVNAFAKLLKELMLKIFLILPENFK